MLVVLYKVAYYFRVVIFIGFIVYRVIVQSHFYAVLGAVFFPVVKPICRRFGKDYRNAYIFCKSAGSFYIRFICRVIYPETHRHATVVDKQFFEVSPLFFIHVGAYSFYIRIFFAKRLACRKPNARYSGLFHKRQ